MPHNYYSKEVTALISGGIDSPVAAHLFLDKGFELKALIFDSTPLSPKEAVGVAIDTVKALSMFHKKSIGTYVVPHAHVQKAFFDSCAPGDMSYSCIFSRRFMLRVAEQISSGYIVTGDSLGQVASQTLRNLLILGEAVKLPVLRPLIGLDKEDIVKIAKKIGTYEISAQGGIECALEADYPETCASLERIRKIESEIKEDLGRLMNESLEGMRRFYT